MTSVENLVSPEKWILLRYHEIALKGGNRAWFEDILARNVKKLMERSLESRGELGSQSSSVCIEKRHGRLLVKAPWDLAHQEVLPRVFGLSSFSPIRTVKTDQKELIEGALEEFKAYVERHGLPTTFKVKTRRSDKALPEASMELDRLIGGYIHDAYPSLKVDLKKPDFTLGIEIRFRESYIWSERYPGQGGLPVGSNARVLSLMSGGLDSPVAAIQTVRRGSLSTFIHFYGTPFVGEDALEKVRSLVRIVNRYQPEPQCLHVVKFGKIQEKIALVSNPRMRTLLYRRMMIRIADALAQKIGAQALITGESLGQVASQTLENIATINSVAQLPVLRPLIAWDKDEIIERAHRWGTFETSILPATDCCTLFADRHPILRSTLESVAEEESRFSVPELVQEGIASIERVSCR